MTERTLNFYLLLAVIIIVIGVLLYFSFDYISKKTQEKKDAAEALNQSVLESLTAPNYEQTGNISAETLKSLTAPIK